jgi:filamentous hemagglutinin
MFRAPTLSFLLVLFSSLPAVGQIVADPNAPGGQKPVIQGTANGLPLVDITTPTGKGVSVNQYRQFDVQRDGAVLNNNRDPLVASQIGGMIPKNPFLLGEAARVIVNQVNSQNI